MQQRDFDKVQINRGGETMFTKQEERKTWKSCFLILRLLRFKCEMLFVCDKQNTEAKYW